MYNEIMKLIPQNSNILCKPIKQEEKKLESGFVYKVDDVKLYEVVSTPVNYEGMLKPGDIVVANSTGTSAEVDGVEYVMFKDENIMAKTIE